MKTLRTILTIALGAIMLGSCNNSDNAENKKRYMPNITGKPGEVLLVLDKNEDSSILETISISQNAIGIDTENRIDKLKMIIANMQKQ